MKVRIEDEQEVEHLLRKITLQELSEHDFAHQWLWEVDRWKELVFALLTRVTTIEEAQLRHVVTLLRDLDLLDIEGLAAVSWVDSKFDLNNPRARRFNAVLLENGLSDEEAANGLAATCAVARGLHERHQGKIQCYLRQYGEMMLRDLSSTFTFEHLSEDDTRFAFTYWLQNVLNMPIPLRDADTVSFCAEHKLTESDLLAAADRLNLNVALLDDIVHRYVARRTGADRIDPYEQESTKE
jgi:hypothetical protein